MIFNIGRKPLTATPLLLTKAPAAGLFAGTQVGTPYSWVDVETLCAGDQVLTAQHGAQELLSITPAVMSVSASQAAARQWPLRVPEGAIGNSAAMLLCPDTRLVIEHDDAEALFGTKCVSLRAETLIAFRGIARARVCGELPHYTLRFADAQSILIEGNVFVEVAASNDVYRFLPLDDPQARLLIRRMAEGDAEVMAKTARNGLNTKAALDWI